MSSNRKVTIEAVWVRDGATSWLRSGFTTLAIIQHWSESLVIAHYHTDPFRKGYSFTTELEAKQWVEAQLGAKIVEE